MRVFVLRHAERSEHDATFHSPLIQDGLATSQSLSHTLASHAPRFTHIYSSPFVRCVQTIYPYCVQSDTPVVRIENALYEFIHKGGGHDPMTFRQSWDPSVYPQLNGCVDPSYASWWPLAAIEYNETELAMKTRVQGFYHQLKEKHGDDDVILLVTHQSAINALLSKPNTTPFQMGTIQEVAAN